ncbi:zf-HC2 domain-containing protein [Cohnella faecalis]|uniref:Anti-sigma-W factor RsiW n=1 Tax=Cohnella faecalis TaxID=2315694 RepID=A0A398D0M9_9BACL|nr:zf-HC2 domain-containing protein [Cohnella faecalis]RIE05051.1 anti-sigma factor [Cohnella faecalis]
MKCNVAVAYIHEYLDGDLPRGQVDDLQKHLAHCSSCETRLSQLERVDAFARAMPAPATPPNMAEQIMKSLPKSRRSPSTWTKWVRRHPAASAAAMFLVVMLSSFVAMWNQDQKLSISGPDLEHVIIEGHTVTVPEGQKVTGDLTIVNGSARVLGDLQGDLTVIDGNVTLASTAHIAGQVKEIDRAVDWLWYKVTSWFGTLAYGQ